MSIKLSAKTILVVVIVAALVGVFVLKVKPFQRVSHGVDAAGVAACQKQVETTYTTLIDTASLTAPATAPTIQKEEQDAKNDCITSNTH